MEFKSYVTEQLNRSDRHQLIIGAVSPRPIALVSTLSEDGKSNLAPYSFFNAISSTPPLLAFSVSTIEHGEKDTLRNIKQRRECVINIVDMKMARQMSLCSVNFEHGVSEFGKSGLTPLNATMVKAPRVQESPVQFECTVKDILVYGNDPGAANLIVCEVIKIHVRSDVMAREKLRILPGKLDAVGRLGRSYYCSVNDSSVFEMYQAVQPDCIGFDLLPLSAFVDDAFTKAELAELASCTRLPNNEELRKYTKEIAYDILDNRNQLVAKVKSLLNAGNKMQALTCLLLADQL